MQPAIFLDRDNTLIANDGDLGDPAAVRIIDGVGPGLRALREAGYRLIVVTNQAGVARGKFSEEDVDAVHQRIATLIDEQAGPGSSNASAGAVANGLIDRFYYCPYHPEATLPDYRRDHPWRKPHPGMILQAARDMGLDLSRSWMIGDQERDVLAGKAAGCRTVLFSRDAELAQRVKPTDAATTFTEVVKIVLQHRAGAASTSPALNQPAPQPTKPAPAPAAPAASVPAVATRSTDMEAGVAGIRRAVNELTEAIRDDRLRRVEFRFVTMLAGLCQLLALTLALLGLLQLDAFEVFAKWMLGAALAQMLTMTLLLLDLRG